MAIFSIPLKIGRDAAEFRQISVWTRTVSTVGSGAPRTAAIPTVRGA
jgi:hypothetical protein